MKTPATAERSNTIISVIRIEEEFVEKCVTGEDSGHGWKKIRVLKKAPQAPNTNQ